MKKTALVALVLTLVASSNGLAQTAQTTKTRAVSAAPKTEVISTQTRVAADDSVSYPWGLGVATAPLVTETASSISAVFYFNERTFLQAYFGVDNTSPFNFGVGGLYKRVVAGNMSGGVHLGGGVGVGTRAIQEKFFLRFTGVAGFHFELPGIRNVFVQADAGPSFLLSSGHNSFSLTALSPLLGLSMVYIF